jgi:hypothetical protein
MIDIKVKVLREKSLSMLVKEFEVYLLLPVGERGSINNVCSLRLLLNHRESREIWFEDDIRVRRH